MHPDEARALLAHASLKWAYQESVLGSFLAHQVGSISWCVWTKRFFATLGVLGALGCLSLIVWFLAVIGGAIKASSPPCCTLAICNFTAGPNYGVPPSPDWKDNYILWTNCRPGGTEWQLPAVGIWCNGTLITKRWWPSSWVGCTAFDWGDQPFWWGPLLNISGPEENVPCWQTWNMGPLTDCNEEMLC